MGKRVGLGFVMVFAVGLLSACGDGSTPGTQVTRVSSVDTSAGPASAVAAHQVVYQVDVVQGKPDLDLIGFGYNDPNTGQSVSLTPSTAPLPWSKSFTGVVDDNKQLSVSINNDSDASLSCTILVDGQSVATSISKPHNADPSGNVCLTYLRH